MNAVNFKLLTTRAVYDIENYRIPSIFQTEEEPQPERSQKRSNDEIEEVEEDPVQEDEELEEAKKTSKSKRKTTAKKSSKAKSKGSKAKQNKENIAHYANLPEVAV
jgi:hypothetical protein